jgi:putative phosphoribosyl transferase
MWPLNTNFLQMKLIKNRFIQDREQAGRLLSIKLLEYKNTNTVVVGIPTGGVCVASVISDSLGLPLEVMPCRTIKHPADNRKNIGSVSQDEVIIHDVSYDIPQEYIHHQTMQLQNEINSEKNYYYGDIQPISLNYKTVILVDDVLQSIDTMIACLKSIKKQKPFRIVIAVPVIYPKAARMLNSEADDVVFLFMNSGKDSGSEYFVKFPDVKKNTIRDFLNKSKINWNYDWNYEINKADPNDFIP